MTETQKMVYKILFLLKFNEIFSSILISFLERTHSFPVEQKNKSHDKEEAFIIKSRLQADWLLGPRLSFEQPIGDKGG